MRRLKLSATLLNSLKGESGFTLMELLTAAVIMTLIMGVIFLTLSQTMKSIDHSREYLSRLRMVDLVFNRLQRDIMSAFIPLDDQALNFLGKDSGVGDFAEDSLQFLSNFGALSHLVDGGLYQVKYNLHSSTANEGKTLVWEAAPIRGGEQGKAKALILANGIQGLNIEYYHEKDWIKSFDATSYGILPQAVKIDLGVITKKGVQWQQLVVEVPAGGQKTK